MKQQLTASDVARRLGVPPRRISDLFYQRKLDDNAFPIVEGRRRIPESMVPKIRAALKEVGFLPNEE